MCDKEQFEKLCKGLECCTMPNNEGVDKCKEYKCPYRKDDDDTCIWHLMDDALSMLKAQEPRVMTLEELSDWTHINPRERKPIYWENRCEQHESQWMLEMKNLLYMLEAIKKKVGRFWTSRPTDEQRKAVKWNATD